MPTDAEWEKAARGGLVGKLYPWGNEPPNDDLARHQGETYRTHIVNGTVQGGSYPPNGYGLYDMAGNVAEWCYTPVFGINNTAITRGGSWFSGGPWFSRVYVRQWRPAEIGVGFRCVKDVEP